MLCDHIREDAYECIQPAVWVFSLDDEPYIHIYACNNHLHALLPETETAHVTFLGREEIKVEPRESGLWTETE